MLHSNIERIISTSEMKSVPCKTHNVNDRPIEKIFIDWWRIDEMDKTSQSSEIST